jgi:threonine/homoserine/homoserine lactone efflux protein
MIEALLPSLLSFALASLVIELTPGPNMAYLAALTLSQGMRAGLAAVAGIALGLSVYGIAAAFGLAALIDRYPLLYELLRWVGILYFLWLAWESWARETETSPHKTDGGAKAIRSAFRRGLVTNLLNPKAAIFYVAVLPGFVVAGTGSVLAQTLALSAVFVLVATATHLLVVLAASRLQRYVADPAWRQPIRRALALVLLVIAIWFTFSTAR